MRLLRIRCVVSVFTLFLLGSASRGHAQTSANGLQLVAGRFGQTFDPGRSAAQTAEAHEPFRTPPLTVECWAKLNSAGFFNILISNEFKESGTHWEIFTLPDTGNLCAYLPGFQPTNTNTSRGIVDGRWHYVAMTFDGKRVQLFVDGERVAGQPVTPAPNGPRPEPGPLMIGKAMQPGILGCDGLVDEVRISNIVREIRSVPEQPLVADEHTIGLWHFDTATNRKFADASSSHIPLVYLPPLSQDTEDREEFRAGPSPLASPAETVRLTAGAARQPAGAPRLSLDGRWEMAADGGDAQRLGKSWSDAIPATVPGSVHTALLQAGRIPDPRVGRNDSIAHEKSFHAYWFRCTFRRPQTPSSATYGPVRLVFDGVAIHCTVWLNGELLGEHEGMFGGPSFDVAGKLRPENTLIVKINPVPGDPKAWNNPAWRTTVVFNNVYGWHYSSIPALGIWRSVHLDFEPSVQMDHPFFATRDARHGDADLVVDLHGPTKGFAGSIRGTIAPETFAGQSYHFTCDVKSTSARKRVHLRFRIPDAHPWWPNGSGPQDLYRVTVSFVPRSGGTADVQSFTTGLRTIAMAPLPGGPARGKYDWTFVINGRPIFAKGLNWCTMDPLMDFSRARYDRFLSLAQQAHVNIFRAWGSGMPETDDFYDLCDRKGIMVLQEWPTAWNSHDVQPYDVLEETIRLNTLRLRNHPSLVMYGGGNESSKPYGKAIDMMGRYSVELDGTRPFHRAEPWGGSIHYHLWWSSSAGQDFDNNLKLESPVIGEFGLACAPVLESVLRYVPENERSMWPPPADGSFVHHTPRFGAGQDLQRLSKFASYFLPADSMADIVTGSQIAQSLCLRHTLERARTRWPAAAGVFAYKLNDNYPAVSWSTVDWYGAPKMGHFFVQHSYAPLMACAVFNEVIDVAGKPPKLPVWIVDDNDSLAKANWQVLVRAYNARLALIREQKYAGKGSVGRTHRVGDLDLTAEQTNTSPLLIVVDMIRDGATAQREYYWANFKQPAGCLFALPKTTLVLKAADGRVTVTNTGELPAVAVHVDCPGHADTFSVSDNYLWLDPGESRTLTVNATAGLVAGAWNAATVTP